MVDLTPAVAATPPLASPMSPPNRGSGWALVQQPMASPAFAGAGDCAGAGIDLESQAQSNVLPWWRVAGAGAYAGAGT